MTDLSQLTHDELAAHTRDCIQEGERRLVEDGTHPRALKAYQHGHDAFEIAMQRLSGPGGPLKPLSGGTPKGP